MHCFSYVLRDAVYRLFRTRNNVIFGRSAYPHWFYRHFSNLSVNCTMPFYAVRKGRQVGIFETWAECEAQVKKFTGAQFKKFSTRDQARAFIDDWPPEADPAIGDDSRKRTRDCVDGDAQTSTTAEESEVTKRQRSDESSTSGSPYAVVYTDGACVGNGAHGARGGIGVFWGPNDRRNVSEPLPCGRQTNNRAEILACARAIEQARESGLTRLEIRTDSHFTIDCVTRYLGKWKRNGWVKSDGQPVLNMEELQVLDQQKIKFEGAGGRVIFTHVSGHCGEPGNEAADRLAVQGASMRSQ